jgi:hypothetical protein
MRPALITLSLVTALVWGLHHRRTQYQPQRAELLQMRDGLAARLITRFDRDGLRREDGWTYGVDLFSLLRHAAEVGDAALYARVREAALAGHLIVRADDPWTQHFVAWRRKPGVEVDASGTTEALRLAAALTAGADAFSRPHDRALAAQIAGAYVRHAAVEQGVWFIRNYFNFGTRAFANDSFLVDYEPDVLQALVPDAPALADAVTKSVDLVRRAQTASGLIRTLIQPDVATVMPDLPLVIFSPDDIVQINNVCTVALGAAHTAPDVGQRLLSWVRRQPRLPRYARGRDGVGVVGYHADISAHGCLIRLAVALEQPATLERLLPQTVPGWRALVHDPGERIYAVTESLLSLNALLRRP